MQNGQVWCTTQSLFQQSMELADLIVDMNRVFTKGTPAASTLKFSPMWTKEGKFYRKESL